MMPASCIASKPGDLRAMALPKLMTVPAIGVIFTPEVTHADSESRSMLAIMNPGSLVTKERKRSAGADRKPMNGISDWFRLIIAFTSNGSAVR